jgi:hypothetical protein
LFSLAEVTLVFKPLILLSFSGIAHHNFVVPNLFHRELFSSCALLNAAAADL